MTSGRHGGVSDRALGLAKKLQASREVVWHRLLEELQEYGRMNVSNSGSVSIKKDLNGRIITLGFGPDDWYDFLLANLADQIDHGYSGTDNVVVPSWAWDELDFAIGSDRAYVVLEGLEIEGRDSL